MSCVGWIGKLNEIEKKNSKWEYNFKIVFFFFFLERQNNVEVIVQAKNVLFI